MNLGGEVGLLKSVLLSLVYDGFDGHIMIFYIIILNFLISNNCLI